MSTDAIEPHRRHADAVCAAVVGDTGETEASVRAAVLARARGGDPVVVPYDSLVQQISTAAYRVTDAQVDAVRVAAGSDKGAFEVVMAACVGAGLARWEAAVRVIEEASDAPA